jgi:hypothetical protein
MCMKFGLLIWENMCSRLKTMMRGRSITGNSETCKSRSIVRILDSKRLPDVWHVARLGRHKEYIKFLLVNL